MPLNRARTYFRIAAMLEGASYVMLIFIAVPLKYFSGDAQYVELLGMPHGLLFIAYLLLAYLLKDSENWSLKDLSIIITASIIPFGTFYIDWKYLRR